MPQEPQPIREILVPLDFSECSLNALEFAKRIAVGSDARLHLLYVDDDPGLISSTTSQSFRDQHESKMALKFVDLMPEEQQERFRPVTKIRFGTAYHEIESYAAEHDIDLIVMGNIGRSAIVDVLIGSITKHVTRHAKCPVLSVGLDH